MIFFFKLNTYFLYSSFLPLKCISSTLYKPCTNLVQTLYKPCTYRWNWKNIYKRSKYTGFPLKDDSTEPQSKIIGFLKIINIDIYNSCLIWFKRTTVNWALSSLHEGSFEITLTVSLDRRMNSITKVKACIFLTKRFCRHSKHGRR